MKARKHFDRSHMGALPQSYPTFSATGGRLAELLFTRVTLRQWRRITLKHWGCQNSDAARHSESHEERRKRLAEHHDDHGDGANVVVIVS